MQLKKRPSVRFNWSCPICGDSFLHSIFFERIFRRRIFNKLFRTVWRSAMCFASGSIFGNKYTYTYIYNTFKKNQACCLPKAALPPESQRRVGGQGGTKNHQLQRGNWTWTRFFLKLNRGLQWGCQWLSNPTFSQRLKRDIFSFICFYNSSTCAKVLWHPAFLGLCLGLREPSQVCKR